MFPLPKTIIAILSPFAGLFSNPTWQNALVLLTGAILCSGSRTVTAALKVMGLNYEKRFEKYHRVLNRASWSTLQAAKILLGLLIELIPDSYPILIAVDDTLERRKGNKISAKGYYRDAVRSSQKRIVKCYGLKWVCMMLLVPLPWCKRPWALPFLTVLAPSKKANEKQGKRHKTTVDWTMQMVTAVSRLIRCNWILIGDGAFASIELAHRCVKCKASLISRLRLDARLFEAPTPSIPGKRGRKPIVGKRISLKALIVDKEQIWQSISINWYGGETLTVSILTGVALWYTPSITPIQIRWVLVRHPKHQDRYEVFFSTDIDLDSAKIINWFILRWSIEVTFEEGRRHLGLETQRQWSDLAILRTTPILFGLFSIVTLITNHLFSQTINPILTTAWYKKEEVTFSDAMAFVRRLIWSARYFDKCTHKDDLVILNRKEWDNLINSVSAVA